MSPEFLSLLLIMAAVLGLAWAGGALTFRNDDNDDEES